jgi:GTPase Era involved in 16S rRNA processing
MYDTPGLLSFTNADKNKTNEAWTAVNESDTIVLVVDCLRRINQDLIDIVRNLSKYPEQGPSFGWDVNNTKEREIILVLSKVDLCNNKRKLYGIKTELEDYIHFSKIFITSAETGFGTEELLDYLKSGAVKRDHTFEKF